MQYDHLGRDHVSVIWNREVPLVWTSDKYTRFYGRPFGTVDSHPYNGGVLTLETRNTEIPLYALPGTTIVSGTSAHSRIIAHAPHFMESM